MLAHCGAHCIGRANVCPIAGRAAKSVTQGFGSDAAPSLLMPRPNAREDSYLY
jgi:hypothetical protein